MSLRTLNEDLGISRVIQRVTVHRIELTLRLNWISSKALYAISLYLYLTYTLSLSHLSASKLSHPIRTHLIHLPCQLSSFVNTNGYLGQEQYSL